MQTGVHGLVRAEGGFGKHNASILRNMNSGKGNGLQSLQLIFKIHQMMLSDEDFVESVNSIIDYRRCQYNLVTKAGEWVDVELDYTVYEMMYSDYESVKKTLTVSCYGKGTEDTPLYIGNIKTMEKLSALDLGSVYLVTEKEPKDVLPEGKSEIICHKSPWQK